MAPYRQQIEMSAIFKTLTFEGLTTCIKFIGGSQATVKMPRYDVRQIATPDTQPAQFPAHAGHAPLPDTAPPTSHVAKKEKKCQLDLVAISRRLSQKF